MVWSHQAVVDFFSVHLFSFDVLKNRTFWSVLHSFLVCGQERVMICSQIFCCELHALFSLLAGTHTLQIAGILYRSSFFPYFYYIQQYLDKNLDAGSEQLFKS